MISHEEEIKYLYRFFLSISFPINSKPARRSRFLRAGCKDTTPMATGEGYPSS